jgi:signal transduction histidine kinase
MNLSIKNRIALYSVLGIASLSLVVFVTIYFVVKNQSIKQIDDKLFFEVEKHIKELTFTKDSLYFAYRAEWQEREHLEIEVYPLFVQVADIKGRVVDKSPNLLSNTLSVNVSKPKEYIENSFLNESRVRQIQTPVYHDNELKGFLSIATSFGDTKLVLDTLLNWLCILYPLLLLVTFFTSRLISGITIKPVTKIANIVSEIHAGNLNRRVPRQNSKDELHTLSVSINDFLNRIDETLQREKQFTADASHQLRTPLAVIKGNLEVLIRKQRDSKDYIKEIKYTIEKIDNLSDAVDKLLILARLNSNPNKIKTQDVRLYDSINELILNYKKDIINKELKIILFDDKHFSINTNRTYFELILDNLISNAVKYAFPSSRIQIEIIKHIGHTELEIINSGPVIDQTELNDIFNPFYRNKHHETSAKGYGLGLAIVAKVSEMLGIKIIVSSEHEKTSFKLIIPQT